MLADDDRPPQSSDIDAHRSAVAIVVMVGSGWEIYDASPLFGFTFPQFITIGHWLGGAIAWRLAAMWLLAANGLIYVLWGLASGHFRRKFLPLRPSGILHDAVLALHLRLSHDGGEYNSVQRRCMSACCCLASTPCFPGWRSGSRCNCGS
jgi:thiosulfate reductase cytochrome b subunit